MKRFAPLMFMVAAVVSAFFAAGCGESEDAKEERKRKAAEEMIEQRKGEQKGRPTLGVG